MRPQLVKRSAKLLSNLLADVVGGGWGVEYTDGVTVMKLPSFQPRDLKPSCCESDIER
jgi:hypothetical protein